MLEDYLFLIVYPPPTHSLLKWQRWSVLVFPWLPPKVTQCSQNVAVSLCTLTLFQAKAVKWRILHSVLSVPGIWSFHPSFWVYLHTDIVFLFFFICGGFCHTLKWNSHGFTCIPHPDPPSHLPLHPLPLGFPSAPGPSACLMHPTWAGDLFHPR